MCTVFLGDHLKNSLSIPVGHHASQVLQRRHCSGIFFVLALSRRALTLVCRRPFDRYTGTVLSDTKLGSLCADGEVVTIVISLSASGAGSGGECGAGVASLLSCKRQW